ncbi:MAG: aspartyl protease family protein [Thiolinea sp.]
MFSLLWLTACSRIPVPEIPSYKAGDKATVVRMHALHTVDMGVLPLVKVKLGPTVGWWLIDTGSSHNLVASDLVQRAQLRVVGSSDVATIGGRQLSTHHQLPVLQIGQLKLDGQSASAIDLSGLSAHHGYKIDGVLGMPALVNLVMALDFRGRTVRFSDTASGLRAGGIPFDLSRGVPIARLALGNNRQGNFILDTGNATALVILPSLPLANRDKPLHFVEVADLGGMIPTQLALLPQLRLGQRQFRNVPVSLPLRNHHLAGADGSLGNMILSRQEIIFDFPRQRLFLQAFNQQPASLPGDFGFLLSPDNRVSVINDQSSAAIAGLRRGDQIVAVGGQRPGTDSAHSIWQLLSRRQNAELTIRRNGQLITRQLQRAYYLPVVE